MDSFRQRRVVAQGAFVLVDQAALEFAEVVQPGLLVDDQALFQLFLGGLQVVDLGFQAAEILAAAQHGLQHRFQLLEFEGLGQETVRSGAERSDLGLLVPARGQHHDR